ncbi:MAG: hypothetical protein ABIQ16_12060, partial [Polyangiaceae bacterium]
MSPRTDPKGFLRAAFVLSLCVGCHSVGTSPGGDTANGSAGTPGGEPASDAGVALAPWAAQDLGEGQCLAINGRGQVLGLDSSGSAFLFDADGTRKSLGAMPDGSRVLGAALGAKGEVVGFSESSTGRTAVVRTGGTWQTLSGLTGSWSAASSIDDDGQIVGTVGGADGEVHAFLWKDGTAQPLPLSPVDRSSAFVRVGRRVAGVMTAAERATHAFVVSTD